MTINEIKFKLKDGREAILRSPKEEDIESTLEYLVISSGETDYILRYPEECEKYTPESREGVMQLELEFVEGNARARYLYEKMGFRITGVRPNAIRLKDGTLLNEYMMVKELCR